MPSKRISYTTVAGSPRAGASISITPCPMRLTADDCMNVPLSKRSTVGSHIAMVGGRVCGGCPYYKGKEAVMKDISSSGYQVVCSHPRHKLTKEDLT